MLAEKIAYRSDDLYTKSEMISSLQSVLHISIFNQDDFPIDNFEWAFNLLESLTDEMIKGLKELTELTFDNLRKKEPTLQE